jgi:hypothetical protein
MMRRLAGCARPQPDAMQTDREIMMNAARAGASPAHYAVPERHRDER